MYTKMNKFMKSKTQNIYPKISINEIFNLKNFYIEEKKPLSVLLILNVEKIMKYVNGSQYKYARYIISTGVCSLLCVRT